MDSWAPNFHHETHTGAKVALQNGLSPGQPRESREQPHSQSYHEGPGRSCTNPVSTEEFGYQTVAILPSWSDKTFPRSWGGASGGHGNQAAGAFPSTVLGEMQVSIGLPIYYVQPTLMVKDGKDVMCFRSDRFLSEVIFKVWAPEYNLP